MRERVGDRAREHKRKSVRALGRGESARSAERWRLLRTLPKVRPQSGRYYDVADCSNLCCGASRRTAFDRCSRPRMTPPNLTGFGNTLQYSPSENRWRSTRLAVSEMFLTTPSGGRQRLSVLAGIRDGL